MLNLCWRPSRPKTDADDAGDAFDFPFRGLFQDHLTRGPKHRKNRCFLNPTRRIHRKLQHHQWPGGGSGVGRRLGGGCPITFGYQPKASGSATGPVGRRPDLRAAAHCRRPLLPARAADGFHPDIAGSIDVLWYKVYLPSLSESCGIKCTHCHCCCPLAQSVPIVIGSNVVVTVLWQKVYPLSLSESFGTKCTYRHCHSSLVESVSIVIVWVLWHKVYLLSLSQFFGTKCTHPHCHRLLSQSLSTVIVRLLRHKSGPFFSNSTTFLWSVAPFFTFFHVSSGRGLFFVILSRLFGAWSCFLYFTPSTSESFGQTLRLKPP